jgi:hypothetical protein
MSSDKPQASTRPAIRARKPEGVANEVVLNPLVSEFQVTEE